MKLIVEQSEVLEAVQQWLLEHGVEIETDTKVMYDEIGEYADRETVGFKLVATLKSQRRERSNSD